MLHWVVLFVRFDVSFFYVCFFFWSIAWFSFCFLSQGKLDRHVCLLARARDCG